MVSVVILVRYQRSDRGEPGVDTAPLTQDALASRAAQATGWKVRSSGSDASEPSAPAARQPGSGPANRPASADRGTAGAGWTSRAGGAGGAVVTGNAPGTGRAGGALAGAGQGIRVDAAAPVAAVPFEGARQPGRRMGGDPTDVRVVQSLSEETENSSKLPPPEEGGPVLSIPFDQSTQPERGEGAVFEQGVAFESGEGAVFSTDSQFVIPNGGNIKGEAGAVAFWVQPQWEGGAEGDASLVQLRNSNQWENRLQVFKNGRYLRFLMTDAAGVESNVGATIDNWQPGEWHHVTASWGDGTQAFYVDGRLIGQVNLQGQLEVQPGTPLYIGSDIPKGGPSANGALKDFRIYNRAALPDDAATWASGNPR